MKIKPLVPAASGPAAGAAPILVGVSACLLGQRVRWDGGHKADAFLSGMLGRYVQWVPLCPEVEVGLPVPRDTLRLVRRGEEVRMVMPRSGADHTHEMRAYAVRTVRALADRDLCGFVLKKDSPTCGMGRVRVYSESGGTPTRDGRGLFAEELVRQMPHLPIEEEGRLFDRGCARTSSSACSPIGVSSRSSPRAGAWPTWWRSTPRTSCCSWPIPPRPTPAWGGSWPRQRDSRARRCASATRASSWPP